MSRKPTPPISALEASSYHHPNGGGPYYAQLREMVVRKATEMGYDVATMSEHGVVWADDQDPFGHVSGGMFPHFGQVTNFRLFESFQDSIGVDKFKTLMAGHRGGGIGVMTKSFETDIKRPVSYPDSIIVAVRLGEVHPDRYFAITSMWSLRQQAIVAETRGYVVFFDYGKGKPANLIEAGGVYADLHAALVEKCSKSKELVAEYEKKNPPRSRGKGKKANL